MNITCKDAEIVRKPNSTYKIVTLIGPILDTVGDLVAGFGSPSEVEKMLLEYVCQDVPTEAILPMLDEDDVVDWCQKQRTLLDPEFDMQEMVDAISDHKYYIQYIDDLLRDIPDEYIETYARETLGMEVEE